MARRRSKFQVPKYRRLSPPEKLDTFLDSLFAPDHYKSLLASPKLPKEADDSPTLLKAWKKAHKGKKSRKITVKN